MTDLDIPYERFTMIFFLGLLFLVFRFPDFVAVVIIVASVAGLAIRWMSRQYDTQQDGWRTERRKWEEGERWW